MSSGFMRAISVRSASGPMPGFSISARIFAVRAAACRSKRAIRNSDERGIVFRFVAAIDIPMSIWNRMCLRALRHNRRASFAVAFSGFTCVKCTPCGRNLRNSGSLYVVTPWPITLMPSRGIGGGSGGFAAASRLGIARSRRAKRIQLMRRPQMRRKLLDKLPRRIHPVVVHELLRKLDLLESCEPFRTIRRRKRRKRFQFLLDGFSLDRKFVVVLNNFAQQARHKTRRQLRRAWRV